MKRITSILLILIYLPATVGIAIHSFYCCGKLDSVKVQFISNSNIPQKQSGKKHCCDKTTLFFRVNNPQQPTVSTILFTKPAPHFHPALPTPPVAIVHTKIADGCYFFRPPPLRATVPLFLKNESLLI